MTKEQKLNTLHSFLIDCTSPEGKKCGSFYRVFRMFEMDNLTIDEKQELFKELQNMGFIAEYTHLPGAKWGVPDRWTCIVINRNLPFTNTIQSND
jgi:hypothetical protein